MEKSKYTITSEIIIHAPIEKVWEVLTDIEKYSEWNSFIRKVHAPVSVPVEGTSIILDVCFYNGVKVKSKEKVSFFEKPTKKEGVWVAEWKYDFVGFVHLIGMSRGSRIQKLRQLPDGSTHYFTVESFRGWGIFLVPLKGVQMGFDAQAADLKKRCEE
jgi:hypothetical protein